MTARPLPLVLTLALSTPALGAEAQDIPEFRVDGTVQAGMFETLELLLDIPRLKDWDTECLAAEVIRRPSKSKMLWRYVSDVPWPADDREAIVWSTVKVVTPGKQVRIEFKQAGLAEAGVPKATPDGQVRVPVLKGRWILTAKGPGQTHVDYRAKTVAGGSVPNWLVAQMGESSPRALFKGLKKRAKQVRASGLYADAEKTWIPAATP